MAITGEWDRRITRRALLRTGGSFAAGLTLAGLASSRALAEPSFGSYPFTLGVASGDPTPKSLVLWTRLAPDPLVKGGGLPADQPYEVRYELAWDEDFRHIHRQGSTVALPDEAHSVRVELDELPPEREWYYRFKAGEDVSPVGRTRTTPPAMSMVPEVTFAFVSCQHFAEGYFTPYADVAAADIEAVIFLGDYIYEGGARNVRAHTPAREVQSRDDYRIRHAQYKTDPDLQAAHAAHPWLVTWDDHEFKNNYANLDVDSGRLTPEQLRQRRADAYMAYWEHMPLARARKPTDENMQLYRRFHWGKMATFSVLDGRQYRSDQPLRCTDPERDPSGYCPDDLNPERTMLGAEQHEWLLEDLATTKRRWNVIAQQTAFGPFNRQTATLPRNFGVEADNWDGYVAERQRILDWLVEQQTPNPIVLTGDSHANWIRNIPPDYRNFDGDPVATELMGTSISSGGDPPNPFVRYGEGPLNPHIVFRNNNRGYVRCSVTPDTWTAEFRIVDTVLQPQAPTRSLATFVIENGRAGAVRV